MNDEPLKLLLLVAHPDDAEARCGGLMTIYRRLGHAVKWVSLTNGDAGHHQKSGEELARIRDAEAADAAKIIGAEYEIWDTHDGHLLPTLELRWRVIREIRSFQPDLVLTHRTCDYHPDHRAVGQLVQDASYLVTVPLIVPDVPAMRRDPVVAYITDPFTRPSRLRGDIVIDVTEQLDTIVAMFDCHRSQVYEWLPYSFRIKDSVPDDEKQRKQWIVDNILSMLLCRAADDYRRELIESYGDKHGQRVRFAEVYEISEHAAPLDSAARRRLFAFLPECRDCESAPLNDS